MSFLSEMQPVWKQEANAQEEFELLREPTRTWTEVKLPNIPIALPNSPPSPKSRAVSRATRRASESCLFCNNQACKALHQDTEIARVKSSVGRSRKSKDAATTNAAVKNIFQSVEPFATPRARLDSSQGIRLRPKETNTDKRTVTTSTSSWEPFSCLCQNCGEKFGKHSIAIHQKHCSKHPKSLKMQHNSMPTGFEGSLNTGMQKVATIVTMGLASGPEKTTVYAALPPRPETRTIRHSTLRSGGIGLPKSTSGKFEKTESSVQCDQCQQIVAVERLAIHKRLCVPNVSSISSCDVVFPSNFLRIDDPPKETVTSSPQRRGKTPSKVCYICGREFGSHSIAIHEPQCLKKWQTENRKLPISERKPLPKKIGSKPTIVRALSKEGPEILESLPDSVYRDEGLTERIVQRYYQNCYSQFEQDLIPCKKCGRTFAPDRIKLHQPKCNAKPLVKKTIS